MRSLVELVGVAAVFTGLAVAYWPAAVIVGGVSLITVANIGPRRSKRVSSEDAEGPR